MRNTVADLFSLSICHESIHVDTCTYRQIKGLFVECLAGLVPVHFNAIFGRSVHVVAEL